MKKCRKCGIVLTSDNSYFSGWKYHIYVCKKCAKRSAKEWRTSHRGLCNKRKSDYRHKVRLDILRHYSNGKMKCGCCGESNVEFLTIDHIQKKKNSADYKEKGRKICGSTLYKWLKKNKYPEGYRVLCFNCNCSLGFWGYCPHKRCLW